MLNKLVIFIFLIFFSTSNAFAESVKVGKMTGGTEVIFPEWFKESFLDFR